MKLDDTEPGWSPVLMRPQWALLTCPWDSPPHVQGCAENICVPGGPENQRAEGPGGNPQQMTPEQGISTEPPRPLLRQPPPPPLKFGSRQGSRCPPW